MHNWLDTEGHVTTTGFLRWQQLPAGVNPLPVLVQVVHKDDAAAEFSPAELVTPAEREAQILARQRHVQKRYGE